MRRFELVLSILAGLLLGAAGFVGYVVAFGPAP